MTSVAANQTDGPHWLHVVTAGSVLRSTWGTALVVAFLLGLSWFVTYLTGGAGRIPPHWFYAPIFLAAFRFGTPGATFAAVAAGVLAGPLMPLDVESGTAQALSDWGGRAVFFLTIGLFMAAVMARGRVADERRAAKELELEAVRVVSESVSASLERDQVLRAALDRSLEVSGLDIGSVSLLDEGTGEFVPAAERNVPERLRRVLTLPIAISPLGRVVAERRPLIVSEKSAEPSDPSPRMASDSSHERASVIAAPLDWEGRTIGILALGSIDGRPTGTDTVALVAALARPIASAVGNAGLYGALQRLEGQRRDLLARLVHAEEEERRRIAADIHDDPIQAITAAGMRLDLLKRSLSDPEHLGELEKARAAVGGAVDRLRSMLFQLHPPSLEREGLTAALQALLNELEKEADFRVWLDLRIHAEPALETRTHLYRIVLEALANVRKHARASVVDILLEERDGGLCVRVEDDGVGFSPEDVEELPGHLGLPGMRERAELVGGWCRVESVPGAGTTVEAWIPAGSATEAA